ncbi:unnamed protein product [Caenorhabditis nigoni]
MFLLLIPFIFCSTSVADPICAPGYTLVNNNCWRLFPEATEPVADELCRTNGGGILAAPKNAIDNRGLLTILNGTNIDRVWLGMSCTGLSPSTCQWADKTSVTYSSFSSGFPNHRFGECVYYSADGYPAGQWASGECDDTLPFICELPTTTPNTNVDCPVNYNNHCYSRTDDPLSFSWGQADCAHTPAGNLVSIHSYLENRFITSLYNETTNVWIGALAPGSALIVWTDGTPNDYYNLKNIGTGSCVSMSLALDNTTGIWASGDCEAEKFSLCKYPVS